ncbi:hypothetical protein D3C73_1341640 [compost metagenome]
MADHQRRRNDHGVTHRAHDQAVFEAEGAADHAYALAFVTAAGGLVLDQLDRAEQAQAAYLAHQRVVLQLTQTFLQVGCHLRTDLLDDLLVAQDAQVFQAYRSRHRVAGIGEAVVEVSAFAKHLGHLVTHDHTAHGDVTGSKAFGDGHQVGLEVVVV